MADSHNSKEQQVADYALQKLYDCLQQKNDGRAFANFLLVFKLAPLKKVELKDEFLDCLGRWVEKLSSAGREHDALKCQHEACLALPDNPDVLNTMGTELFKLGFLDEASSYFRKSLHVDSTFLPARENLQNLCSHVVERWHYRMLNDKSRNAAYREALHSMMQAGYSSVLDVGSGTGLLSMFAVEAGYEHVYACEMSKVMFDTSQDCLKANHLTDRITLIHKNSTDLLIPGDIPQRMSLLVTETFDAGLLGEHILSTMKHAWDHLLIDTPSFKSKVIPQSATVYIAAIESEDIRKQNRVMYPGTRYIDYGRCEFVCAEDESEPYTCHRLTDLPAGYRQLTDVIHVKQFFFNSPQLVKDYNDGFKDFHTVTFTSHGQLDGFVLWFDLDLDGQAKLTSNPSAGSSWEQAIYSINTDKFKDSSGNLSMLVCPGDKADLCIECKSNALWIQCNGVERYDKTQTVKSHNMEQDSTSAQSYYNETSNFTISQSKETSRHVLSHEEISRLNDLTWNQAYCQAIEETKSKLEGDLCVLSLIKDISMLPVQSVKIGAQCVCMVSDDYAGRRLLSQVAEDNGLNSDCLQQVDRLEDAEGSWNLLLVDVVEPCGGLRQQVLEDIALARMSVLSSDGVVIPQAICVYGMMIESEALLLDSRVLDDDRTLGFQVDAINDFQMTHHVDVCLSTLKHTKLSQPFNLFTFDLNQCLAGESDLESTFLHHNNSLSVTTTETGTLCALVYWFDLKLSDSVSYSTLDNSSHIHQAAFMLREPLQVDAGVELKIKALCKNSCLNATVISN